MRAHKNSLLVGKRKVCLSYKCSHLGNLFWKKYNRLLNNSTTKVRNIFKRQKVKFLDQKFFKIVIWRYLTRFVKTNHLVNNITFLWNILNCFQWNKFLVSDIKTQPFLQFVKLFIKLLSPVLAMKLNLTEIQLWIINHFQCVLSTLIVFLEKNCKKHFLHFVPVSFFASSSYNYPVDYFIPEL